MSIMRKEALGSRMSRNEIQLCCPACGEVVARGYIPIYGAEGGSAGLSYYLCEACLDAIQVPGPGEVADLHERPDEEKAG